jgi:hypothetical protein
MSVRRWLAVLLVGVLFTLSPLAYSDLPDQLWLAGFYDGGDEDDAIVHIQTHLNAVEPPAPTLATCSVPCVHAPPQLYECVVSAPVLSARHTRAPPTL